VLERQWKHPNGRVLMGELEYSTKQSGLNSRPPTGILLLVPFEQMKAVEEKKGLGYVQPGDKETAFVRTVGNGNRRELFGNVEKNAFEERSAPIKAGDESSMVC
jgi:hypothetical protein